MRKFLLIALLFISLGAIGQTPIEKQVITNYTGHDTTVYMTMSSYYYWINYLTFTNADKIHDTILIDYYAKVKGSNTYEYIRQLTCVFTDTVAITSPLSFNNVEDTEIWANLKFRYRKGSTSDMVLNMYFRKMED
jgi:hypothetical protein